MIHLLLIYENRIATVELLNRVFAYYVKKDMFLVTMKKSISIKKEDIIAADVIFFIRPNYHLACQIGKIAKEMGKFIIVHCDDDLLNIKDSFHDLPWRKESLIKLLHISDIFSSSSKRIVKKYITFMEKKRSFIFNTSVEQENIVIKNFSQDYFNNTSIKVLYAASSTHRLFFEKYINPILEKVVQKYGKRVSFTFIGVKPVIDYETIKKGQFYFYDSMPLAEYRDFVNSGYYDIGLAPLEISEFTKCKYFNKYLEYSMAGMMGIYTKTEPYTDVIVNGVNGLLVENDPDEWMSAICHAIDNSSLRAQIILNAQKDILNKFNPDILFEKFITEIPECVHYKTDRMIKHTLKYEMVLRIHKLIYISERIIEMGYKALQAYKQEGSKGVYKKIKYHINKGGEV